MCHFNGTLYVALEFKKVLFHDYFLHSCLMPTVVIYSSIVFEIKDILKVKNTTIYVHQCMTLGLWVDINKYS